MVIWQDHKLTVSALKQLSHLFLSQLTSLVPHDDKHSNSLKLAAYLYHLKTTTPQIDRHLSLDYPEYITMLLGEEYWTVANQKVWTRFSTR